MKVWAFLVILSIAMAAVGTVLGKLSQDTFVIVMAITAATFAVSEERE